MIELADIHHCILQGITLRMPTGKSMALLGHSGSGKTSLLRIIAGLDLPDSGERMVKGSIGMVFQSLALWPHITVRQHLEFVLHDSRWTSPLRQERTHEILKCLGLLSLADRLPGTLSGGEQQRVAIARAFAPDPDILLLDEPLSHLDNRAREEIRESMIRLLATKTVLIATHDPEDARSLASESVRLENGRIVK